MYEITQLSSSKTYGSLHQYAFVDLRNIAIKLCLALHDEINISNP